MRTFVYVDGFNLYHMRLRNRPEFKWLNLKKLSEEALDAKHRVLSVKYYTARVSEKFDKEAPARQQAIISALETIPEISIYYGNFLFSEKWAYVVRPPKTKPENYKWNLPLPELVWINKTEEKGSDVNLATHLVRDALTDQFDAAIVISNDTDLVEPIRVVTQEVGKAVGILSPIPPNAPINPKTGRRPQIARSLRDVASFCLYIHNTHLRAAQFPDPIVLAGGASIQRPTAWKVNAN